MPRQRPSAQTVRTEPAANAPAPPILHHHAVYTVEQLRAALRLRRSTIRREVREKRLRIAKRAGRYYLLGQWVREWLEGGEVRPKRHGEQPDPGANGTHAG